MPHYTIRTFGDPVLKQRAAEITDIDGSLVTLVEGMVDTMREAAGAGLAAPQIGVQKRLFIYDLQDDNGPRTIINPTITETDGEFEYEEGCLSVPGLYFPIVRPNRVHLKGYDLDGNEIDFEADEFHGRVLQHELDHLDGILLLEKLDAEHRKEAMRALRDRQLGISEPAREHRSRL